jgi:hypothetical protein
MTVLRNPARVRSDRQADAPSDPRHLRARLYPGFVGTKGRPIACLGLMITGRRGTLARWMMVVFACLG